LSFFVLRIFEQGIFVLAIFDHGIFFLIIFFDRGIFIIVTSVETVKPDLRLQVLVGVFHARGSLCKWK
jgi:hypothetical protein